MKRSRFSIAGLMAMVLCCAIGTAALRSPSLLWFRIIATLTLTGLSLSLLGMAYRTESRRAFWVGFATFGWGYWLFALSSWISESTSTFLVTSSVMDELYDRVGRGDDAVQNAIRESFMLQPDVRRLSTELDAGELKLERAKSMHRNPRDPTFVRLKQYLKDLETEYENLWISMYPKLRAHVTETAPPSSGSESLFGQIGHNLFALIAAILGGMIGLYFHRTRDQ